TTRRAWCSCPRPRPRPRRPRRRRTGSPPTKAWPSSAGGRYHTTRRSADGERWPPCPGWPSWSWRRRARRPGRRPRAAKRRDGRQALDRRAFCLRKRLEHEAGMYLASLSSATIVYKGMLTALQLEPFYPDLTDPAYASALAMVHSRFSTNTLPSWPLAHPYR